MAREANDALVPGTNLGAVPEVCRRAASIETRSKRTTAIADIILARFILGERHPFYSGRLKAGRVLRTIGRGFICHSYYSGTVKWLFLLYMALCLPCSLMAQPAQSSADDGTSPFDQWLQDNIDPDVLKA